MLSLDDTIAAVASAPGGAARGIVRLSGPNAIGVVKRCFQAGDPSIDLLNLRGATTVVGHIDRYQAIHGPMWDQFKLPADLFVWPTHRSYTRQPMAEIHTVGSPPLLEAVLQSLCNAGARLAQPGEFTLRAFLAGRIDLIEAEAVLGVIDAADRRQLEAALDQLAGGLSRPLQNLRNALLDLLADLEAGLDFVEDDIRFVQPAELQHRLAAATTLLQQTAQQLLERAVTNGIPRVVLMGLPNAGKSSLFNSLLGDAAALVSPQPGTTRDYLTATIDADGLKVELIDTAGTATAVESVDTAAQELSIGQQNQADIRLLCIDASRSNDVRQSPESIGSQSIGTTIVVLTKCDLTPGIETGYLVSDKFISITTSSRTKFGLDTLRATIRKALTKPSATAEVAGMAGTSARIRESLILAIEHLAAAKSLAANSFGEELVAVELRAALAELGKILGVVYTDDLLDRIFSRFCIGK